MTEIPSILAISYYYPPLTTPRAIRLFILSRYMQMNNLAKWSILSVSPNNSTENKDYYLSKFMPNDLIVRRTYSIESKLIRKLSSRISPFSFLSIPDPFIGWFPYAISMAENMISEGNFDIIYSFSSPITSHLVGRQIHKKYGIPWIAYFSDPITNSPIMAKDSLKEKVISKIEEDIFTEANLLLFTNDFGKDWALKKYSSCIKNKAYILPHSYDPSFYTMYRKNNEFVNNSKFTILYTGIFYGNRSPEIIFKSISLIRDNYQQCFNDLQVIFLGSKSEIIEKLISKFNMEEVITTTKQIPYLESLCYMRDADLLLVYDANLNISPFFPSKIIDYLGAGKPILGITPQNGPTYDLLKSCNQPIVSTYDEMDIAIEIQSLWALWKKNELNSINIPSIVANNYSVEKIAQQQIQFFTTLN